MLHARFIPTLTVGKLCTCSSLTLFQKRGVALVWVYYIPPLGTMSSKSS